MAWDYLTMQNRIAREVFFAVTAQLSGKLQEIKEAIHAATRYYETEQFWFNEQQATSTTASGFDFYTTPSDYVQMYSISVLRTGDRWETLEPVSFDEIEQRETTSTGYPQVYCSFNQQFRLAPTPNGTYELRLSYLKTLTSLNDDTDTNAWMVEAEPMIRAKAKAILLADATHDPENAILHDGIADEWFRKFQRRTAQYLGTSQIRAQAF